MRAVDLADNPAEATNSDYIIKTLSGSVKVGLVGDGLLLAYGNRICDLSCGAITYNSTTKKQFRKV